MRILLTTDTVGGVWTFAAELAAGLTGRGVNVTLATMGGPLSDRQRAEVAHLPRLELAESLYRLEWMADPWDDVAACGQWLLDLARRRRVDLVHLNHYAHGQLPWGRPVVVVGHSCVLSWWQAVKGCAAPSSWDRYRREVTAGLRAADAVAAPTDAMLRALQRHYGPLTHTAVIHNAVTLPECAPREKELIVVSAGRLWDEAKNVAALARAAEGLPAPVYLAGESQHPDGGGEQFPAVQCLGRLERPALMEWLCRAAVYAAPARYEPFGLSILEAASCACALVLGDIGSLREVWGKAAVFVPPDDADALRAAIRRLLEDEPHRLRMAQAALQRARRYLPQRMTRGYMTLYGRLLRRSRASGAASAAGLRRETA